MHIALGYVLLIFFHLLYNVDKAEEPSNTEKQSNNTEQSNNKSIKCLKLLITIAALLYLNRDFFVDFSSPLPKSPLIACLTLPANRTNFKIDSKRNKP